MFETKSESVVGSTVLNPEFVKDIETERVDRSIDDYILNLQTSVVATNIPEFLESASATLGSSVVVSHLEIPTETPFIPTIPVQPTISDQRSPVSSPPTTPSTPQAYHISSHPSTPHTPITSTAIVVPTPPTSPRPVSNPPRAMAAQYAPLVLPQNLDSMSADYQSKIPLFDGTKGITTQQHVDKMNDFFDLHEIDEENVTMRLFVQTFGGEVWKWFRALPTGTINSLAVLHRQFLDHWEVKKNPLQILFEYENIKRNAGESVQDYCVRFNTVYNAIPADIKPPMGLALISTWHIK